MCTRRKLCSQELDDPAVACETIARPLDHSICALPADFLGCPADRLTSRSTPADDRLDTPLEQTLTLRRSIVPTISPELTRPETGQNGSRERGFGTLKYERLFLDEIDDAVTLAERTEHYRLEYNNVRPHEAIAWNRPRDVHLGHADPTTPTFQTKKILPIP